jgi:hypothetical protein
MLVKCRETPGLKVGDGDLLVAFRLGPGGAGYAEVAQDDPHYGEKIAGLELAVPTYGIEFLGEDSDVAAEGGSPFFCETCQTGFKAKVGYDSHMRKHAREALGT